MAATEQATPTAQRMTPWMAEPLADDREHTLASIVHELSNPLAVILGTSEIMMQGQAKGQTEDIRIARIHAEAERSMRIIRNIMDMCRPNAAHAQTDCRIAVDLNECIRHATALCEDQLERQNVSMTTELPWRSPLVMSRPGELTQVFLNLITNAIQAIAAARRPGAITVEGTQLGNRVCITIEDDGPGFSEREYRHLFEPYFTTKSHGTGLGLNLCRKIVRSAGGDLWATRNPDHGAVFTIELPLWTGKSETSGYVA